MGDWQQIGDVPVKTRLSEHRIGYRVTDIKEWLDKRRETESWQSIGAAAARVVEKVRP
jgi:hypothetical protein